MKKIIYSVILVVLAYLVEQKTGISLLDNSTQNSGSIASTLSSAAQKKNNFQAQTLPSGNAVQTAYNQHQSDIQVQQQGRVVKVLADDLKGSRHQKFILKIDNLSILIAHNIDLAPRIDDLRAGDTVEFYGEYEWNAKGGIVHWTHRDPANRHINGWLKHNGKTYQ